MELWVLQIPSEVGSSSIKQNHTEQQEEMLSDWCGGDILQVLLVREMFWSTKMASWSDRIFQNLLPAAQDL